ncbi:uncharacterized protein L199_000985 [Kwoniella botswanensis]|uniref:uncharacterized protein n=1 Tax=Kwoniella botswanensis TaxID=1268659 RepID=UPI00315C688D
MSSLAEIERMFNNRREQTDAKFGKLLERVTKACRSASKDFSDLDQDFNDEMVSQLSQRIEALSNPDDPNLRAKLESCLQDNLDYMLAAGKQYFTGYRLVDLKNAYPISSASYKEVQATLDSMRVDHKISVDRARRDRKAEFRNRQAKQESSVDEGSVLQQSSLDEVIGWLNENRYEINLREDPPYAYALMQYVNDDIADMQWEHSEWGDTQVTQHGRNLVNTDQLERLTLPSERYDHMMSILKSSGVKDNKAKELWRSTKRIELDHIVLMKKAETIAKNAPRSMAREIQAQRARLINSLNEDESYTADTGAAKTTSKSRKPRLAGTAVKDTLASGECDLATSTQKYQDSFSKYEETSFGEKTLWSEFEAIIPELVSAEKADEEKRESVCGDSRETEDISGKYYTALVPLKVATDSDRYLPGDALYPSTASGDGEAKTFPGE